MIRVEADFSIAEIERYIDKSVEKWVQRIVDEFRKQGKKFTTKARSKSKNAENIFQNITYNLRSSIGYCILKDGKVYESYFPSIKNGTSGEAKGRALAEKIGLAEAYKGNIVLVLVQGSNTPLLSKARAMMLLQCQLQTFQMKRGG